MHGYGYGYEYSYSNYCRIDLYSKVLYLISIDTLREESNQTNVILQYILLAAILIAVCSVIQQS